MRVVDDWAMTCALEFLGVGGSNADSPAAVLTIDDKRLLIDCGFGTLARFRQRFQELPEAIYITHCHLDHIGDLESLFYALLGRDLRPTVFAASSIVELLHRRLAIPQTQLAEGGRNFWDHFCLTPIDQGFWFADHWFDLLPARHHQSGFCHGLRLAGRFIFTGDTKPIPEVLAQLGSGCETVFHDAQLGLGNPSHSGLSELRVQYPASLLRRLYLYHYGSSGEGAALRRAGFNAVAVGDCLTLPVAQTPHESKPLRTIA